MALSDQLAKILEGVLAQQTHQMGIIENTSKMVDELQTKGLIAPPTYRLAPATATPVKASSPAWFRGF